MEKILIICKENPFPSKDGISLTITSFVLRVENEYDIFYFIEGSFFKFKDLTHLEFKQVDCLFVDFEYYVCSPILQSIKHAFKLPKSAVKIALLSDCYTFVLWTNIKLAFRFGFIDISSFKDFIKIPIYYLLELMVSKKFDFIFLQTPKDVTIFRRLFFSKNISDLPNLALNKDHINYPLFIKRNGIGWVASFEGSYLKIAKIFFENTLVKVLSNDKNCVISVLGKGSEKFIDSLSIKYPFLKEQLLAEPFYLDIKDFYFKRKIIICPVFKDYGLINKTVESLTYGCITIGDQAAFNGINGFVSGIHGFTAENFEDFINVIEEKNKIIDETISLNAISLIQKFNKEKLYTPAFKEIFKNNTTR